MSQFQYTGAVRSILDHLENTQTEAIEEAARRIVASLGQGGAVFCSEIGHANQHDFLNRAGGLAAVHAFTHSFSVAAPVAECQKEGRAAEPDQDLLAVRLAVQTSSLRKGDVMLVGSVSGKSRSPVELALACREKGVAVVAFTSMTYTAQVASSHPSGKRLYEVADVVIDNGAPYGDAAVSIPGMSVPCCPVSGTANLIAGWMLWERVITLLAEQGNPPTVFLSVNREGGMERYLESVAAYNEKGL